MHGGDRMTYSKEQLVELLRRVDDVLLDYIERLEKLEGSGLYHGRGLALAVKMAINGDEK
jgi:hypothetical protein